jgi:hypothetical protein
METKIETLIHEAPTVKGPIQVWQVGEKPKYYFVVTLNSQNGAKDRICTTENILAEALQFANGMYFAIAII